MATVPEERIIEEQRFVVLFFLWAKVPNAKDIPNEMFPAHGWRCLLRKVVHNCVQKRFADEEEVETEMGKWLRQQSKNFYAAGFRHTGKSMGQVYEYWWRICREINNFSRFECHMFYVLCPFVTYLLSLPRT
jgi:hypothetical protein